jgi:putative membrane protein
LLWIKSFHLISVVCWFAGLFYLPRLFVYHAMSEDTTSRERFKIMERKLYRGITTPSMIATVIFGLWMTGMNPQGYFASGWLLMKLLLVTILIVYHFFCGHLVRVFAEDNNHHGHVFYRWFNEFPVFILIAVVILAVVKPF